MSSLLYWSGAALWLAVSGYVLFLAAVIARDAWRSAVFTRSAIRVIGWSRPHSLPKRAIFALQLWWEFLNRAPDRITGQHGTVYWPGRGNPVEVVD